VARGDVIVFFDADLKAAPSAIETLCAPILSGATAGTYTADIVVGNPENPWADCWTRNRGAAPGVHFPERMPRRWDNFRAVRRDLFLEVGGFDDIGYGEDKTLARKLGILADQVPGARFWHHNPSSLREVWQNACWIGRGPVMHARPRPPRYRSLGWTVRRGLTGYRSARRGGRTHAK
jgi:hypothetical protein